MGLLLSVLVVCIGVAELIAFYAHVRRSLVRPNAEGDDLETIVLNYKRQLTSKYRRILSTIYEEDRVETNYSLSPSPGIIFNSNPTHLTLPTHSPDAVYPKGTATDGLPDIQKQASTSRTIPENVVAYGADVPKRKLNDRSSQNQKVEVPSLSIPFEKIDVINQKPNDSIPEHSLPAADYESGQKTREVGAISALSLKSENLDDNLIQKPFPNSKALPSDDFFFEKVEVKDDLPLNSELGKITTVIADESGFALTWLPEASSDDVPSTELWTNSIRIKCGGREWKSRSRSPPPLQCHQVENTKASQELPTLQYDTLNLSAEINLLNVNEEGNFEENFRPALRRRRRSKSFSSETDVILIGSALRKVVSATQLVPRDYWRRSPSPFERFAHETNLSDEDVSEDAIRQFQLVNVPFDDGFKNSLDGVNEEKKREFRKKRHMLTKSRDLKNSKQQMFFTNYPQELAVSSEELAAVTTQKRSSSPLVLPDEREEETPVRTVQGPGEWEVQCEPSTSSNSTQNKKPEPFWVNGTYSEAGLK